MSPSDVVLAEIIRGSAIDCRFRGSIAVTDPSGGLIAHAGNPNAFAFMRSTAKPFQTIALLEHPGAPMLNLSSEEIAVMSGSHNGEEAHVQILSKLLKRHDLAISDLRCGTQPPLIFSVAIETMLEQHKPISPVQHNCSGTHIAIILLAKLLNEPIATYCEASHPAQARITSVVAGFLGLRPRQVTSAIDSCGIPTFGASIRQLARSFALLASLSTGDNRGKATTAVRQAMVSHPFLIAGTDRLETDLMRTSPLVAKIGADGVYCVGALKQHLGVAVKIEAGSAEAAKCAAVETLRQLLLLQDQAAQAVERYRVVPLLAPDGSQVGVLRPTFSLRT